MIHTKLNNGDTPTIEGIITMLTKGNVDAKELSKEETLNLSVYFQLANRSRRDVTLE